MSFSRGVFLARVPGGGARVFAVTGDSDIPIIEITIPADYPKAGMDAVVAFARNQLDTVAPPTLAIVP